MGIRSDREIYHVIEPVLREATEPMTCVDLMEIPEVFKQATEEFGNDKQVTVNKLSDTLGFMWRRELLTRYPTSGNKRGTARFAYVWSEKTTARPVESVPPPSRGKTGIIIEELENGVSIEFDKFFVFIRPK